MGSKVSFPAGRFWNELLGERLGECGLGEGVGVSEYFLLTIAGKSKS